MKIIDTLRRSDNGRTWPKAAAQMINWGTETDQNRTSKYSDQGNRDDIRRASD